MQIFTENWKHIHWSPCRLGDQDLHSDRHKMLVVPAQKERPLNEIPDGIRSSEVFAGMIAEKESHGSVSFMDLMIRVRQSGLYELPQDRIVLVNGLPFDAWQIWCVCVSMLGCTDSVSWHLKQCEVGGELYLTGSDWRAVIKGCSEGTGAQVLP